MKGYDVKIRLDDFRPITWRDMIIPEKITFKELNRIIKITYGFLGYHLSAFTFKDSDIEILDLSNDIVAANEAKDMNETYIDEYFQNEKKIFYEYDFGDGWAFTIEIKKIVDYDRDYPTIKRFKGDYNPIEDCGGVYGLELILYYNDHPDEAPDIYLKQINLLEKFNQEDIQDRLEDFKSDNDFFLL